MSHLTDVSDNSFDRDVSNASGFVLVFFHRDGCSESAAMRPVIEALAANFSDVNDLKFVALDIDKNPKSSEGVSKTPGFGLMRNGHGILFAEGMHSLASLQRAFQQNAIGAFFEKDNMLHDAIENQDIDGVRAALKSGADVNSVDDMLQTNALSWAIMKKNKDIVAALMEDARLDVNAVNKLGTAPLMVAARLGQSEIVDMLLAHPDIDINVKGAYGGTALLNAAAFARVDIVKTLLEQPGIVLDTVYQGFTARTITERNLAAEQDPVKKEKFEKIVSMLVEAESRPAPKKTPPSFKL